MYFVFRTPIQTIFDTSGNEDGGVVAVGMTPDARYLATLSAAKTQVELHTFLNFKVCNKNRISEK